MAREPSADAVPTHPLDPDVRLPCPGEITLVEFRKSLRDPKLGLPTALLEVGRVDALFQQLDEDHGGSLDLSEMRIAFQVRVPVMTDGWPTAGWRLMTAGR